ncbi:MAG: hypothetical protein IIZ93_11765 [Acidaminococcaceae bacterium]|nr:hypothetical protein [Acidaminococcaceae bacterium]
MKQISECKILWKFKDGSVMVAFRNCVTKQEKTQAYKTEAAAKTAITKFEKRMARIYG